MNIGERNPLKAKLHPIFYQIDGNFETSYQVYENFMNKMFQLNQNENISIETKEKIKSAIRYFRLGSESIEIEQKFINYWIGIEYIFSNYDASSSTFSRFKEFFSTIYGVTQIKREIIEFHCDIKRLEVESKIPMYGDNIFYLLEEETFDFIIDNFINIEPLLSFRAYELKTKIFNSKNLTLYLNNQKKGLQAHLVRIYRVRNEIIHEAAIKPNIESLTSDIRHFLAYIIDSILHFFIDPIQAHIDSKLTLDDYFTIKQIAYSDMINNPKKIEKIINLENSPTLFASSTPENSLVL